MHFKKALNKFRRANLCSKTHKRKPSLDIGSPTNVRHIPITDSLPGLTSSERLYIREKASSDAIHLLGLQTSLPSPSSHFRSPSPEREPSLPLLNAASANLPEALPTPPRSTHNDRSPPRARMRGMCSWDFVDGGSPSEQHNPVLRHSRLSFESGESSTSGPRVLRKIKVQDNRLIRSNSGNQKASERQAKRDKNQSFGTLDLEFEWEDRGEEKLVDRGNLGEEFEMQDTVGGHTEARDKDGGKGVGGSDSESDMEIGEMRGLVKV